MGLHLSRSKPKKAPHFHPLQFFVRLNSSSELTAALPSNSFFHKTEISSRGSKETTVEDLLTLTECLACSTSTIPQFFIGLFSVFWQVLSFVWEDENNIVQQLNFRVLSEQKDLGDFHGFVCCSWLSFIYCCTKKQIEEECQNLQWSKGSSFS